MRLSFTFFLSLIALAVCDDFTCGDTLYGPRKLNPTITKACDLLKEGSSVGRNHYPHVYKNFEKIHLTGSAPYYEFPLLPVGVYDGDGSPGPDRVIITQDCKQAGVITHHGAANKNSFVPCSPASVVSLNSQSVFALCFAMMLHAVFA
ncbi:hypothetical protein J3458_004308 [Metarhizium acridum]|uniref:ribonuclease T1 n=1 Tax=Metarhizium acridum (strain CQMa 102) TaxID=655827 RepID=E9DVW2_METAQ|nr:guanyl-specific ribonuclease F1 [Metarhizium acridum CQMa 102]EFY92159.1 guanyl-specific ribonuclease F1 [Metarhizium acridum CQMa 102]KAG8419443.1 hypothetical protein J3458_004308 [Metarhizium acridum]